MHTLCANIIHLLLPLTDPDPGVFCFICNSYKNNNIYVRICIHFPILSLFSIYIVLYRSVYNVLLQILVLFLLFPRNPLYSFVSHFVGYNKLNSQHPTNKHICNEVMMNWVCCQLFCYFLLYFNSMSSKISYFTGTLQS